MTRSTRFSRSWMVFALAGVALAAPAQAGDYGEPHVIYSTAQASSGFEVVRAPQVFGAVHAATGLVPDGPYYHLPIRDRAWWREHAYYGPRERDARRPQLVARTYAARDYDVEIQPRRVHRTSWEMRDGRRLAPRMTTTDPRDFGTDADEVTIVRGYDRTAELPIVTQGVASDGGAGCSGTAVYQSGITRPQGIVQPKARDPLVIYGTTSPCQPALSVYRSP